jgi:hypothetical protein
MIGPVDAFVGLLARLAGRLEPIDVPAPAEAGLTHAAVALPGGRAEAGDATLLDVAVRETAEEVGIDAARGGRVLGRLPTLYPMSAGLPPIAVTPFIVLSPPGASARADPDEVEEVFWMPLAALRNGGPCAVVRRVIEGETREWPAYPSPGAPSGASPSGSLPGSSRSRGEAPGALSAGRKKVSWPDKHERGGMIRSGESSSTSSGYPWVQPPLPRGFLCPDP